MDFLAKFNFQNMGPWKVAGLALVALVVIGIGLNIVKSTVNPLLQNARSYGVSTQSMGMGGSMAYDDMMYAEEYGYEMEAAMYDGKLMAGNTAASAMMPSPEPPRDSGTVGDDAEDFEITQYNASIETTRLEETCAIVSGLKEKSYVIFENASEYDRGCDYTFKVKKDNVDEVLALIDSLDPKNLSESTYTIKRTIENLTNETEILQNRLDAIDDTLAGAIRAYDDITALATRNQDAESLAKIIDSKVNVIERLTRDRIDIVARIDRLERSTAEQLDRLEYTYFYVNVYESKFIDPEQLKDSWKEAVKGMVRDINRTVQDITVNLFALLFVIFQYAIYLLILLVLVKYGWRVGKYIWNR